MRLRSTFVPGLPRADKAMHYYTELANCLFFFLLAIYARPKRSIVWTIEGNDSELQFTKISSCRYFVENRETGFDGQFVWLGFLLIFIWTTHNEEKNTEFMCECRAVYV